MSTTDQATDQLAAILWERGLSAPPTLAGAIREIYRRRKIDAGNYLGPIQYRFAPGADLQSFDFEESKHPRGQPDNKGQFASAPAGGKSASESKPPATKPPANSKPKKPAGRDRTTTNGKRAPARPRKPAPDKPASGDSDTRDTTGKDSPAAIRSQAQAMRPLLATLREGPLTAEKLDRRLAGVDPETRKDTLFILQRLGAISIDRETGAVSSRFAPQAAPPKIPQPKEPAKPPGEKRQRKPRAEKPAPPTHKPSPIPGAPPIPIRPKGAAAEGQPPAPAPTEIRQELTPEQEAERQAAREKAERDAAERKAAADQDARRAAREERIKTLATVAEEHGIAPDDLLDVAKDILSERKTTVRDREAAKTAARQITGLTAGDLGRLENQGYDHTSGGKIGGVTGEKLRRFDEFAGEVARDFPGMIGDPDDPKADMAAGLWELIREGAQPEPTLYDPDILWEAAAMVRSQGGGGGGGAAGSGDGGESGEESFPWESAGVGSDVGSEEEAVPFTRPGQPERYRRECRHRLTAAFAAAFSGAVGVSSRGA